MRTFRLFLILAMVITGCKKEKVPVLTTADISSVNQTSAICGGAVTSQGSSEVISKGICWSTSDDPTIQDSITVDSLGLGSFTHHLTGLDPGTEYFVKAYATNSSGTGYGETKSFTTEPASLPEVTALRVTAITMTPIIINGKIISYGGSQIIDRGFCWNTIGNPTLSDNFVSLGTGSDTFSTTITDLESNTCYYVRAYTINLVGTGYSDNKVSITPFPDSPYYPPDSIFCRWKWIYSFGGIDGGYQPAFNAISIDEYRKDSVFIESDNGVKKRECRFYVSGNTLKYSDMRFFYRIKIRGDNLNIYIIDTVGYSVPLDFIGVHYYKRLK
jgi:hypothetical protein